MKRLEVMFFLCCMLVLLSGCACKHENTSVINAVPAVCEQEGYSGDVYCNDCKETINTGTAVPRLEHEAGSRVNQWEATCDQDGKEGDIYCIRCDELLLAGAVIPAEGHPSVKYEYAVEPTCTEKGRTGTGYCTECNEIVVSNTTIPAKGHVPAEPYGIIEPSCDVTGYTGDALCNVCGEVILGKEIPMLEHQYENNTCTVCGWRVPGLYVNDKLEISWNQLVAAKHVTVSENGALIHVSRSLAGTLYVSESVTLIHHFEKSSLSAVYLPPTLKEISSSAFAGSQFSSVVVFGNQLKKIGSNAFAHCINLERMDWPETVVQIEDNVFSGCTSLTSIVIPETVTFIGYAAFNNCTSLAEIEIPDSVSTIEGAAFLGSGIERFILHGGVNFDLDHTFEECKNLKHIDLSLAFAKSMDYTFKGCTALESVALPLTVERLYNTFSDCISLKKVSIPHTVRECNAAFYNCSALEELILPEGLPEFEQFVSSWGNEYGNGEMTALKRVVWPTTLLDGTDINKVAPNLERIYYLGSEALWGMTASKVLFEDVDIVFDYKMPEDGIIGDDQKVDITERVIGGEDRETTAVNTEKEINMTVFGTTGFSFMQVAIAVDEEGLIVSIEVIEHQEVPGFGADLIEDATVFEKLIGQDIATAQIDVKSGATLTSNGINNALRDAAAYFGK